MKKTITAISALALAASLSVTAFAAEGSATNTGTEDTGINVSAEYRPRVRPGQSIFVDIAWDAMSFTYTADSPGTWNPETHQYENATGGQWSWDGATEEKSAPTITLTNHSDTGVDVALAFATEIEGLTGTFTGDARTDNTLTLASAVGTDPGSAPRATAAFSLSGSGIDAGGALGTVSVTVKKSMILPIVSVSTEAELREALKASSEIRLTRDITAADKLDLTKDNAADDSVIDLNGHTLSIGMAADGYVALGLPDKLRITLKNGTIERTADADYWNTIRAVGGSTVTLDNCTISGGRYNSLFVYGATVYANNCTFGGRIHVNSQQNIPASLTLSGTTTLLNGSIDILSGTVTCLAGTYNFDPTEYVDANQFTVTKNEETGIWTVAAK